MRSDKQANITRKVFISLDRGDDRDICGPDSGRQKKTWDELCADVKNMLLVYSPLAAGKIRDSNLVRRKDKKSTTCRAPVRSGVNMGGGTGLRQIPWCRTRTLRVVKYACWCSEIEKGEMRSSYGMIARMTAIPIIRVRRP